MKIEMEKSRKIFIGVVCVVFELVAIICFKISYNHFQELGNETIGFFAPYWAVMGSVFGIVGIVVSMFVFKNVIKILKDKE